VLATAILVAVAFCIWLVFSRRDAHAPAPQHAAGRPAHLHPKPGGGGGGGPWSVDVLDRFTPPASDLEDFNAPGYELTSVDIDKDSICKNEDVRVRIAGQDGAGESKWLTARVLLPGSTYDGLDVIARPGPAYVRHQQTHVPDDALNDELWDTRADKVVARKRYHFASEDCTAPEGGLRVECATGDYRPDTFHCYAGVWDPTDAPVTFRPVRFDWQVVAGFGDKGAQGTSPGPHWFATLPPVVQTRVSTSYVVEVTAEDAAGVKRSGRGSLMVVNREFVTAEKVGDLILEVAQDPTPRPDGQDDVVDVQVTNPHPEAVAFDELTLITSPCAAARPTPGPIGTPGSANPPAPQGESRSVPVSEYTGGATRLGAGQRIAFVWRMPRDAQRCDARMQLEGHGETSNHRAYAAWVMPTDPRERNAITGDQRDRLMKAIAILSKRRGVPVNRVTPVELQQLEQEGLIPPLVRDEP
jgi:hypothetical protein